MEGSFNSFFRFVLGFSIFIGLSLGLTLAASTLALQKEKEKQVAAAFRVLMNKEVEPEWWEYWKRFISLHP